jgi:hypothetical protein
MGGVQIPAWITVMLGVLVVVGTVGGAWGGQLIAGRNERRRWHRESARERETHWRDKRLEIYSIVLAAAQDAAAAQVHAFDSAPGEHPDDAASLTIEHIDDELRTLWIIGSTDTVNLTMAIRFALMYGEPLTRFSDDQLKGTTREELRKLARELQQQVVELRGQFRVDLGLDAGEEPDLRHFQPPSAVRRSGDTSAPAGTL